MTPELTPAELARLDQAHIWHPFTQMQEYAATDPVIVARGDGVKLIDVHGRAYYDGVGSMWLNVHGHRVPEIDAAIVDQLGRIAHSTLLGQANVPSIQVAAELVKLVPPGLTRVFYSDSGSEAVEIALKMAYQYWRHVGEPQRKRFIAMTGAYHGDTIGAVSAGGIETFHGAFRDLLFPTFRAPYPYPYRFAGTPEQCRDHCLEELARLLREHGHEVCGLLLEPLIAGAAGMYVMPPGYLREAARLCREHGVLLLADEVATGLGRTGRWYACDHEGVQPDLLMTAKGLTGGYLPLAATLATDRIYNAFLGSFAELKTFFHGHSYTGNQLACAAAIANLALMQQRDTVGHVARMGARVAAAMAEWRALPHVGEVRGHGLMWGCELVRDQATREPYAWAEKMGYRVSARCRELGMLVRPLGNVLVFMPPLATPWPDLEAMLAIYRQAIADITGA
jgi:adenosylmethionine-8-amino-7-oxononanoate transaminase